MPDSTETGNGQRWRGGLPEEHEGEHGRGTDAEERWRARGTGSWTRGTHRAAARRGARARVRTRMDKSGAGKVARRRPRLVAERRRHGDCDALGAQKSLMNKLKQRGKLM